MSKTFSDVADDVTEYLADKIKPHLNAAAIAQTYVLMAEPRNGEISFEIPSRYTISGNPLPCLFDAPEIDGEEI